MNQHSAWKTRESLLEKVKDQTDEQSWEDFVYYYNPFIYSVIRGMNISHHDAEEIVQTVLLKSWNKLPEFEYNRGKGRFRGWLCQVTGNTVRDFIRKRKTSAERFTSDQSADTLNKLCIEIPEIEKIADMEWKNHISKLAWNNISKKFSPHVAKAFLMSVKSVPTKEISEKLGIAESSVYVYKCRVQKELRTEIKRLNQYLG